MAPDSSEKPAPADGSQSDSARKPEPAPRLPSARDATQSGPGQSGQGRRRGGGRGRRKDREGKPRPARAMAPPDAAASEADVAERQIEVGGEPVTVRVLGRSGGGRAAGATPLLLLGFRDPGDAGEERERLVVGRSLSGLSDGALSSAARQATVPDSSADAKPFFGNSGDRRRR